MECISLETQMIWKVLKLRTISTRIPFLPLVISVWNKLDLKIRNSATLESLKSKYWVALDLGGTVLLNCTTHSELNFIHVLELFLHLKEQKLKYNFQDAADPLCSCGNNVESTIHLFLQCVIYTFHRQSLLNKIHSIAPIILAQKEIFIIKTFLFWKSDLKVH